MEVRPDEFRPVDVRLTAVRPAEVRRSETRPAEFRFIHNTKPLLSQYKHFTLSWRLFVNTYNCSLNGSSASVSWTNAARPMIFLRKSTGLVHT